MYVHVTKLLRIRFFLSTPPVILVRGQLLEREGVAPEKATSSLRPLLRSFLAHAYTCVVKGLTRALGGSESMGTRLVAPLYSCSNSSLIGKFCSKLLIL